MVYESYIKVYMKFCLTFDKYFTCLFV